MAGAYSLFTVPQIGSDELQWREQINCPVSLNRKWRDVIFTEDYFSMLQKRKQRVAMTTAHYYFTNVLKSEVTYFNRNNRLILQCGQSISDAQQWRHRINIAMFFKHRIQKADPDSAVVPTVVGPWQLVPGYTAVVPTFDGPWQLVPGYWWTSLSADQQKTNVHTYATHINRSKWSIGVKSYINIIENC